MRYVGDRIRAHRTFDVLVPYHLVSASSNDPTSTSPKVLSLISYAKYTS